MVAAVTEAVASEVSDMAPAGNGSTRSNSSGSAAGHKGSRDWRAAKPASVAAGRVSSASSSSLLPKELPALPAAVPEADEHKQSGAQGPNGTVAAARSGKPVAVAAVNHRRTDSLLAATAQKVRQESLQHA